jgi:hypothetical protein
MSQKRIYFFSPEESDGDQSLRNLLGGKGANLAEMYAARKAGDSTPPQHTCGLRAEPSASPGGGEPLAPAVLRVPNALSLRVSTRASACSQRPVACRNSCPRACCNA